ncbi:MAG TPA: hypothetical protein VFE57_07760 [Cyclobacteriaceae bacterium]|jgi:hypothetical protein|nr:hypothetical protein [Cyclobacteriaceae bacterium]
MKFFFSLSISLFMYTASFSQAFIAEIEPDDIGYLMRCPTKIILQSGDTLKGELGAMSLTSGYLKNVTLKMEDGSKRKLTPEEMSSLWVKPSKLAKLAVMSESARSITELTKTDFHEIVNREYIIFEQALRATKKDKPAMMQLLNPGFDHAIKVYADPNANETQGLSMSGISITGGKDKSYLFVKGNSKVVIVKKGSYKKNFDELYEDCPVIVTAFEGEKTKFNDIAGHVFVYDQLCSK